MQAPPNVQRKQAFTLIELMVVIAIIAVLMGLTLGISGAVGRSAAEAKARGQIADLTLEIEKYKADKGVYPADLAILVTWYEVEKYKGTQYLTTDLKSGTPVDPWGTEYYYNRINEFIFRLGSKGPDGVLGSPFGSGDDITSQKQ